MLDEDLEIIEIRWEYGSGCDSTRAFGVRVCWDEDIGVATLKGVSK